MRESFAHTQTREGGREGGRERGREGERERERENENMNCSRGNIGTGAAEQAGRRREPESGPELIVSKGNL